MRPISKEKLYSEEHFIRYCERDEFSSRKLPRRVTSAFLRAAEKDELIVPLLIEKGKQKKDDSTEEEVDIRYYSPFQIFLVTALICNDLDNGELWAPDNKEWYKERGTRYITWGMDGGASWVEHYKAKRGDVPMPMEHNIFAIADDFHKTLKLIHGLEPEDRYQLMRDDQRMFTGAPTLIYKLDPVRSGGAAYVEQYGLDVPRLKRVIASVGSLATSIDPLERWLHYVQRHTRVRKDQLKGAAAVAQDLYGFCDIGYELLEVSYNEKLPPLMDFLYPDHMPYLMGRAEYAGGEDIAAIRAAFDRLREWTKEHADLIAEMTSAVEEEALDVALANIEAQLEDYVSRYGERRYVGSTRRIQPETKLKIEDLDAETKHWVENLTQQRVNLEEERGNRVTEEMRTNMLALEMTHSIGRRMSDLARLVSGIAHQLSEATWPLSHKAEREKEMAQYPAQEEFNKRVQRDDPEFSRKHHEFWTKDLKEYQKPQQDKLDQLDEARKELRNIGSQSRLAFCAACRKKPVRRHFAHYDRQISQEAVCDECFKKEAEKVMVGTDEDRKNTKYAEWICDYCDQLLLKFALGNTIAVRTQNKVPIQIDLEYGHIEMQAKCPKCGHMNERPVDWGWLA